MGSDPVELFVQSATPMQDAIENIRRDPPNRQTGNFGNLGESLWRHGAPDILQKRIAVRISAVAISEGLRIPLAAEYAKSKNPAGDALGLDLNDAWKLNESATVTPWNDVDDG
jgi:hypothetical protein